MRFIRLEHTSALSPTVPCVYDVGLQFASAIAFTHFRVKDGSRDITPAPGLPNACYGDMYKTDILVQPATEGPLGFPAFPKNILADFGKARAVLRQSFCRDADGATERPDL